METWFWPESMVPLEEANLDAERCVGRAGTLEQRQLHLFLHHTQASDTTLECGPEFSFGL